MLQIFEERESNYCNFKLNKQQTIRKHLFFRQKRVADSFINKRNKFAWSSQGQRLAQHHSYAAPQPGDHSSHHHTHERHTCSQNRLDLQLIWHLFTPWAGCHHLSKQSSAAWRFILPASPPTAPRHQAPTSEWSRTHGQDPPRPQALGKLKTESCLEEVE
jgi:hypothetical protein